MTTENDPTNPSYYQFPSGAEVIDISENLTGNGAQIVQYTARATRTDGKVKGNPVEDLRKAAWFIEREIARLEKKAEGEDRFTLNFTFRPDPKQAEGFRFLMHGEDGEWTDLGVGHIEVDEEEDRGSH